MTFDVRPRISSPRLDLKPNIAEKLLDFELVDCVLGTALALTELSPPSLNLQVGTGELRIKGYYVKITAAETKLITASATRNVFVQLTRDVNSEVTGAQIVEQAGATLTDGMLIATVVTDATNITTITSKQVLKESETVVLLSEVSTPAVPEINTIAKISMQASDANNKKIVVQALRNGAVGDLYIWG